MRSLFLKIFLSFWIAEALFIVLAILVTIAMRPAREISTVEASQSKDLAESVDAYQTGGTPKLRDYLHHLLETEPYHDILFNLLVHLTVPPFPSRFYVLAY